MSKLNPNDRVVYQPQHPDWTEPTIMFCVPSTGTEGTIIDTWSNSQPWGEDYPQGSADVLWDDRREMCFCPMDYCIPIQEKQTMSAEVHETNDSNKTCYFCGQPTEPLFGKLRICRTCGK